MVEEFWHWRASGWAMEELIGLYPEWSGRAAMGYLRELGFYGRDVEFWDVWRGTKGYLYHQPEIIKAEPEFVIPESWLEVSPMAVTRPYLYYFEVEGVSLITGEWETERLWLGSDYNPQKSVLEDFAREFWSEAGDSPKFEEAFITLLGGYRRA